jgi:hypothetical protein
MFLLATTYRPPRPRAVALLAAALLLAGLAALALPGARPAAVVRGAVKVVAAVATRLRVVSGEELAPNLADWQRQRAELDRGRHARVRQRRFRRDPSTYLRDLEREYRLLGLPG